MGRPSSRCKIRVPPLPNQMNDILMRLFLSAQLRLISGELCRGLLANSSEQIEKNPFFERDLWFQLLTKSSPLAHSWERGSLLKPAGLNQAFLASSEGPRSQVCFRNLLWKRETQSPGGAPAGFCDVNTPPQLVASQVWAGGMSK